MFDGARDQRQSMTHSRSADFAAAKGAEINRFGVRTALRRQPKTDPPFGLML